MNPDEIRAIVDPIGGWLTHNEGELLYKLASMCMPPCVIVEIGSWMGRSTTWLAMGARNGSNVPVYAVDPHEGDWLHDNCCPNTLAQFQANMRNMGLDDLVSPLVMKSEEAAPSFTLPVGLLFIDGNHGYEAARSDLELWCPKVVPGGAVALHDAAGLYVLPGPQQAAAEVVTCSGMFKDIVIVDSIVAGRKIR